MSLEFVSGMCLAVPELLLSTVAPFIEGGPTVSLISLAVTKDVIVRNINPSAKATVLFLFFYKVVSGNVYACFKIAQKTFG